MIQIEKNRSFDSIQDLQRRYLDTLVAPLDTFWLHTMIRYSEINVIHADNQEIGYFCINQNSNLLQFFIATPFLKHRLAIFTELLQSGRITSAMVSTVDPNLLAICFDYQAEVSVRYYQYFSDETNTIPLANSSGPTLRLATSEDDLDSMTQAIIGSGAFDDFDIENSFETQRQHLATMVSRQELFLAFEGNHLMAYGKIQPVQLGFHFGSIGLTLLKEFRDRGIGSHLLTQLKAHCKQRKLSPICATSIDNRAARRIAEKNGFILKHRILQIQLNPSKETL